MTDTSPAATILVLREPSAAAFRRWLPLLLLTIVGGAIRFTRVAHPPLWYDESMVFWRTCGTYGQLLDCLRTDGFVPLHYSLVWVITRFFRPTPMVLRIVPALCGTLMVPGVYFFAKQLLPRKTSQLAAAFTACSAFMLFYSRDAKMYMDAWLFVTLNMGCLLWWFRVNSFTSWLCWVACGAAACGLQITSAIPVAVSLLLLFTQDRMRWQQTMLWLLGVVLIFSGPIGHYEKFNIWIDQVEEDGWQKSQLQWINQYNAGRTGPQLIRYLGSTLIMGWEWPHADAVAQPLQGGQAQELKRPGFLPFTAAVPKIPRERFTVPATVAEIILVMLFAGCLPWPRRWRSEFEQETVPQPRWRAMLWLLLLVVVPVYGFYCRSMPDFAGPMQWWDLFPRNSRGLLLGYWWALIPVLIVFGLRVYRLIAEGSGCSAYLRTGLDELTDSLKRVIVFLMMIFMLWGMAVVMAAQARVAAAAGKPWESLWVPRYIGFIWPAFAMGVAAIIMRLPTRPVRIMAIVFLLGVNLVIAGMRIIGQTEPPVDLMASDTVAAQDALHHTMIRMGHRSRRAVSRRWKSLQRSGRILSGHAEQHGGRSAAFQSGDCAPGEDDPRRIPVVRADRHSADD